MKVRCPQCGNITDFAPENRYRPFCSERCRLIDLGAWADEKYAIPVKPSDNDLEELSRLEESAESEHCPGDSDIH